VESVHESSDSDSSIFKTSDSDSFIRALYALITVNLHDISSPPRELSGFETYNIYLSISLMFAVAFGTLELE
jgi:hypothetical protein